jgi:predicted dehydrogenase
MQDVVRVAAVGLAHSSVWANIALAQKVPFARLVAAAATHDALLSRFREMTGCPSSALYQDPAALLAEMEVHAVLGGRQWGQNARLAALCAEAGVGLMLPAPMCASLDQADTLVTAVQRSGITFMVDAPELRAPAVYEAVRLVKEGAIGQLIQIRHRANRRRGDAPSEDSDAWMRDPEHNASGAFLDRCSVGAQLCSWLLGKPLAAFCLAGTLTDDALDVPDNAILLMKYRHTFGVAEGTWSEQRTAAGPCFLGTDGSIAVEGDVVHLVNGSHPDGVFLTPEPLPSNGPNGVEYFLRAVRDGAPIEPPCDLTTARDAQEILEAGLRAIETGMESPLPVR